MAEHTLPEQRTEMPTDRRMGELRKEGSIFHSSDIAQLASLTAGFYGLNFLWPYVVEDLTLVLKKSFGLIANTEPLTVDVLRDGFYGLTLLVAPTIALFAVAIATIAALAVFYQTNWNVKAKKLHFRFNFLNPITGLKRIVSVNGLMMTLKALFKLACILPIGYFSLKAFAPQMVPLIHTSVEHVMMFSGKAISSLFWKVFWVLLGFAIFDYFWGKYRWLRQNKMTKDEVKDERKAVEGDESTKRKIQAKGLQRIAQRLAGAVPKADVIITNPTHISIALKYDRATMPAPVVLAKGKGFLALKIREIAKEHNIPIIERKPVARALYESTEVGAVIPRELFKAVAEILAYVYRLKNPWKYQQSQQGQ